MFGIGMQEMLLILVVALIVIGPKKLPDLAKTLGKALGEFKRATSDLKDSLAVDTDLSSVKKDLADINQKINEPIVSAFSETKKAEPETPAPKPQEEMTASESEPVAPTEEPSIPESAPAEINPAPPATEETADTASPSSISEPQGKAENA